jgi:glycosyltransferase involved in cell wall biosynthesis
MIKPPAVDILFRQAQDPNPPPDMVTVAVSLYNYAHFLPDCLNSIRAQRHPNLELVVVDDVSTKDDSIGVALTWLQANAERFVRVSLLRHRRNQGLAQARNTGFAHALGSHVFVIDADNEIYPRAIGRLHQAIATSGAGAAYTQLELFGNKHALGAADVWQPQWLRQGNYIDAMALVSRSAWQDVGGYTHIDGGWEDYDFWCKFVEQGYVAAFVPEILCRYRIHGTSMLRTETARSYDALFIEMTLRHPWLKLAPIAAEDRA